MFGRKVARRHKRVTLLAVALGGLTVIGAGCLPDPQTLQSRDLLDRLVAARGLLGQQPPQTEAGCDTVGDVQTRLFGEPGLVDVRPAWSALRDAAEALQAACGQSTLLEAPSPIASYALDQARARWQRGMQHQVALACPHLRAAAAALERPAPC